MSQWKCLKRERWKWRRTQKLERKNIKEKDYNNSSRRFRPWGSRVMALSLKCDSLALRTESTPCLKLITLVADKWHNLGYIHPIPDTTFRGDTSRSNSCNIVPVSQWYGHPRVLSIPILKPLVICAFPVTLVLTLTQIAEVIWEARCPYH